MNYFLIYLSIFCFGVGSGIVLSMILSNQGVHRLRRKNPWRI
jgi:hypothetical protein